MIRMLKQQGLSISEIARQTGRDRKTIRKILKQEECPKYQKKKMETLITPYTKYIQERISKYDLTATRIFREIKTKSYKGGYDTVKKYVRSIKNLRPKPVYIRYETLPGEQVQVDWGQMKRIKADGNEEEVNCFNFVLGYSKAQYTEFTKKRDLLTFMRCHQRAFEYVGGVPTKILYDNLKSVVLTRTGKKKVWNESFMDFAHFYGFSPQLCNVGKPNEKGKVEKNLDYVEKDFFIGTDWDNVGDLNQKCREWLDKVANMRIHGTTGEVPFERLKQEKLTPLRGQEYDIFIRESRKVSKGCYLQYKGNRYSVPYQYSGRRVGLKIYEDRGRIYFEVDVHLK